MKKSVAKKPAKKSSTSMKKSMVRRAQPSKSATAAATAPSTKPAPASKRLGAEVCWDHNRRTCILLERSESSVKYVALDVENGLDVTTADPKDFDRDYKSMVDYPVERAAKLYVEYARGLGATEQVMRMLAKLTTVNQEDIEMATKKKTTRAAAPVKTVKKAAGKAAKSAPAEKAPKAAKEKKAPAEKKPKDDRGPTAASRFQELLMEGKGGTCVHTDDQIFAKVQKEFGLDDGKRSYVKWYRNYLTKQGKNPPAAKE